MSKTSTLILLGVLTILAPFSGLPLSLVKLVIVVLGACVAIVGLMLRAHETHRARQSTQAALSGATEAPQVLETPPTISRI